MLNLGRRYEIVACTSGQEALLALRGQGPFGVILSDMRMPSMSGAELLAEARRLAPNTVRMLLTGFAEIDIAAAAVNDGQVFRFLLKPCPPITLALAFEAAFEQHRLLEAEHAMVGQTLDEGLKVLMEVLSLSNPALYGRASRVRTRVRRVADHLGLMDSSVLELGALFAPLGRATLPNGTSAQATIEASPGSIARLLDAVPRLEPVCELLRAVARPADGEPGDEPLTVAILRVALRYEEAEASAQDLGSARPELLQAFAETSGAERHRTLSLGALEPGMVLAADVLARGGELLVARGAVLTSSLVERLRHLPRDESAVLTTVTCQ